MDYAESHPHVMASVNDLHIVRFDQIFAKKEQVSLRYAAEGSSDGKPYLGIKPIGNHAQWSAAAIFEVRDGRVYSFSRDWDQEVMQVGIPSNQTKPSATSIHFSGPSAKLT